MRDADLFLVDADLFPVAYEFIILIQQHKATQYSAFALKQLQNNAFSI